MIINSQQLAALRQRNDREIAKGAKSAFGYPKDTVRDLIQTIDELRAQKKKWQHIAAHRGDLLEKIIKLANVAVVLGADGAQNNV